MIKKDRIKLNVNKKMFFSGFLNDLCKKIRERKKVRQKIPAVNFNPIAKPKILPDIIAYLVVFLLSLLKILSER